LAPMGIIGMRGLMPRPRQGETLQPEIPLGNIPIRVRLLGEIHPAIDLVDLARRVAE
jgi:hypothetical protein